MKKEVLRTYPIKSFTIFLSIAFVVSLTLLILFIFLQNEPLVIRIMIYIFCSLFVFASGFMLCNQLFFYIGVTEDSVIRHVMFGRYIIPFKKISRLKSKDGFYVIYVGDQKMCTFPTNTKEAAEIIVYLEKKGVKIDW